MPRLWWEQEVQNSESCWCRVSQHFQISSQDDVLEIYRWIFHRVRGARNACPRIWSRTPLERPNQFQGVRVLQHCWRSWSAEVRLIIRAWLDASSESIANAFGRHSTIEYDWLGSWGRIHEAQDGELISQQLWCNCLKRCPRNLREWWITWFTFEIRELQQHRHR